MMEHNLVAYMRALIKFIYSFIFVHYPPSDEQNNMYDIQSSFALWSLNQWISDLKRN